MDATRSPETDQRLVFRVVHHDSAAELACLEGGRSRSRSRWAKRRRAHLRRGSSGARPARRSAPALRSLPRSRLRGILRRAGSGRPPARPGSLPAHHAVPSFERGPDSGKRSASRTAAGTSTTCSGGGGPENDVIVPGGHQDDARAGEQRNAAHGSTSSRSDSLARTPIARKSKGRRFAGPMPRLSQCLVNHRVGGMPKTLAREELQLDGGPAHDSELFLVDGNNLAYRAFFALPEELQTTDGQPTNALLGFTNMLFKLLSDYAPEASQSPGTRGRCTGPRSRPSTSPNAGRCQTCSASSSSTSARSWRRSATATSSSRAGKRTT